MKKHKMCEAKTDRTEGEIDNSTIIGNFNIQFSITEQLYRRSERNRTPE